MTISTVMISKIVYRIDLGRVDGETIPLGVLGQFMGEHGCIMLVSREKLTPEERSKMDWIALQQLANPLRFFQGEVDAAIERGERDILQALSSKFFWSLHVSAPVEVPVPTEMSRRLSNIIAQSSAAEAERAAAPRRANKGVPVMRHPRARPEPLLVEFAHDVAPELPVAGIEAYIPPAFMLARDCGHRLAG